MVRHRPPPSFTNSVYLDTMTKISPEPVVFNYGVEIVTPRHSNVVNAAASCGTSSALCDKKMLKPSYPIPAPESL
jgi:hypothetical protein